jgi:hypothetical protein
VHTLIKNGAMTMQDAENILDGFDEDYAKVDPESPIGQFQKIFGEGLAKDMRKILLGDVTQQD